MTSAVSSVYAGGNRIKVALIATPDDLGAIPSLFDKPDDYSRFLGQELAGFYVGPLLIVMPSGFGIYDGGRSTAAESSVLSGVSIDRSSLDASVLSAAPAVQKLNAAGALKSADIKAPYAYPSPTTVTPGKSAQLSFRLLDDSSRAAATLTVTAGGTNVTTIPWPLGPTNYPNSLQVTWSVPANVPSKGLQFCIVATDAAGNLSTPTCTALKVAGRSGGGTADTKAPTAYPNTATVHPGTPVVLTFRVNDDSGSAAATITIKAGAKSIANLSSPLGATLYPGRRLVRWSVPKSVPRTGLQFCIVAVDGSGNHSASSCTPLTVK